MLKLYDYFRSSASFRVRIVLNLKELEYVAIPIHLINDGGQQFSKNYEAINPHHLVPSLKEGDRVLTQSMAIMEYLEEMHPTPSLLPQDPYEKALVRAFALSIIADLHPLNNLRVLTYLTNECHFSEEQKNTWYHHWLAKELSALETQLSKNAAHDFCFGDTPTLADVCLIPQLFNAKRFGSDTSLYPNLMRVDANCQQLSAFITARPKEVTA